METRILLGATAETGDAPYGTSSRVVGSEDKGNSERKNPMNVGDSSAQGAAHVPMAISGAMDPTPEMKLLQTDLLPAFSDPSVSSNEAEESEKWYIQSGVWPPPRLMNSETIKRHVTWSEVFFDLIYVVVLARLSEFLEASESKAETFRDFALYLLVVWNIWAGATSYGTRFGSNDLPNMIYFACFMMASVSISMNLDGGIDGEYRRGFACSCVFAYCVEALIHLRVVLTPPTARSRKYAIMTMGCTSVPLAILWGLIAAMGEESTAWPLVTIAALLQPAQHLLKAFWPSLQEQWNLPVHFEHFTERKCLMMIIVLGEAVDDIVPKAGEGERSVTLYVTVACFFMTAVCTKLLYFDADTESLENHALKQGPLKAFLWEYLHVPLSGGLIILSTGMAMLLGDEDPSSEVGQGYVCVGVAITLGAMGASRMLHKKDWKDLQHAIEASVDLGAWLRQHHVWYTKWQDLELLLRLIYWSQVALAALVAVALSFAPIALGSPSSLTDLQVSIILLTILVVLVAVNLIDEQVEFKVVQRLRQSIHQAFSQADTAKTGAVKLMEFKALMQGCKTHRQAEFAAIFAHIDVDRSGTISEQEFEAWFLGGAHGLLASGKHPQHIFVVGDLVRVMQPSSSHFKGLALVLDPHWSGNVKVQLKEAGSGSGSGSGAQGAIRDYCVEDLAMVEPRLMHNDFVPGDAVKVVKEGYQNGKKAQVMDPYCCGRIKVKMQDSGAVKTYATYELRKFIDTRNTFSSDSRNTS